MRACLSCSLTSVVWDVGEQDLLGSGELQSGGPWRGDRGLQWSPGVGEGVRPSVWTFCVALGWM